MSSAGSRAASQPAPPNRLVTQLVEKGQLAFIQHAGPVQSLEGDLFGFCTQVLAQAGNQALGKGVLAILVAAVWLGTDAVDDGDRKFHGHPSLVECELT